MKIVNTLKILGFILTIWPMLVGQVCADELFLELKTTHPQVAAVLNQIKNLHKRDNYFTEWNAKSLFGEQVNIHDFEPTIKDLKNLKTQTNLIAGPLGDQRWLIGAKAKGLLPDDTLLLEFTKLKNDHFWLFAEGGCQFEKQINDYLYKKKVIRSLEGLNPYCQWINEEVQKISTLLKSKKVERVILAHSALEPLMKSCGLEVLTLMQHDHDKEVTPKTLKRLSAWLGQGKRILAIKEKGFPTPSQLEESKAVTTIEWSPLQTRPQPLESLYIELVGAL